MEAMKNIFDQDSIDQIILILSSILLLGNIKFDLWEMDDSAILNSSSIETSHKIASLL